MSAVQSELETYQMYVDGQWTASDSGEYFESYNPYTGQPWALIPKGNARDVERAVDAAQRAFNGPWASLNASQRGALLHKLGDAVAEHAAELAAVEVRDNGKLLAEMGAQLNYVPQWYYYYGGLADKIEGAVIPVDKPGNFN
jgi:aldehyde dehydrogenase (NAD+)